MTLIITNGDCAATRIKELNIAKHVLPWRDVLHDGPVQSCDTLEEQSEARALFIHNFGNINYETVLEDFKVRDATLKNAASYAHVELWFEHDLYDQLQLIQILDAVNRTASSQDIYLVQSDDYLTNIPDEEFCLLPKKSVRITNEQKNCATKLWKAFTHTTPELINTLANEESSLPYITSALWRLLQEYPDEEHGLPLSIHTALTPLLDSPLTIGRIFHYMQEKETAKFMGDTSFAHLIDEVAFAKQPLIVGVDAPLKKYYSLEHITYFKQTIKLTSFGEDVLARKKNHVTVNGVDRWIGGVHLTTETPFFYNALKKQVCSKN